MYLKENMGIYECLEGENERENKYCHFKSILINKLTYTENT